MPRSPSRDLADRFKGNRRYFRGPTPLSRAKATLSLVALVAAVGWVVADLALPARAVLAYTHGPLANPHSHWEDNCTACHRPHAAGEFGVGSLFRARDRWHDLTCEKCHAGPEHVATLRPADRDARCSDCHHEHGGRLNSLVRISDDHCTRCHADLARHHVDGNPSRAVAVTSFPRDHPEFGRLAKQPPRKLMFSHAVHMTPGQASAVGGREAMTVARLRELAGGEVLRRYRGPGQQDADLINLNCSSCHRLDSEAGTAGFGEALAALAKAGEPARAVLPPRAAGAHFLPVNFEVHCRACHPLQAPAGASAGRVVPHFGLTHRKQPAELLAELQAGYLRGLLATDNPLLAAPARPGGALDPRHEVATRTIRGETERLTADAQRALLSGAAGCAKCHTIANGRVERLPDWTVLLPAARFDHARHKPTGCTSCHPGASGTFVSAVTELVENERVQTLGIDSCRACHSPSGTRVVLPDGAVTTGGGARHGCVDCHRYHNADHGLQGRGARVLWPERPLDLTEFLRGGK